MGLPNIIRFQAVSAAAAASLATIGHVMGVSRQEDFEQPVASPVPRPRP